MIIQTSCFSGLPRKKVADFSEQYPIKHGLHLGQDKDKWWTELQEGFVSHFPIIGDNFCGEGMSHFLIRS